jgi:hypothetical protein
MGAPDSRRRRHGGHGRPVVLARRQFHHLIVVRVGDVDVAPRYPPPRLRGHTDREPAARPGHDVTTSHAMGARPQCGGENPPENSPESGPGPGCGPSGGHGAGCGVGGPGFGHGTACCCGAGGHPAGPDCGHGAGPGCAGGHPRGPAGDHGAGPVGGIVGRSRASSRRCRSASTAARTSSGGAPGGGGGAMRDTTSPAIR